MPETLICSNINVSEYRSYHMNNIYLSREKIPCKCEPAVPPYMVEFRRIPPCTGGAKLHHVLTHLPIKNIIYIYKSRTRYLLSSSYNHQYHFKLYINYHFTFRRLTRRGSAKRWARHWAKKSVSIFFAQHWHQRLWSGRFRPRKSPLDEIDNINAPFGNRA